MGNFPAHFRIALLSVSQSVCGCGRGWGPVLGDPYKFACANRQDYFYYCTRLLDGGGVYGRSVGRSSSLVEFYSNDNNNTKSPLSHCIDLFYDPFAIFKSYPSPLQLLVHKIMAYHHF